MAIYTERLGFTADFLGCLGCLGCFGLRDAAACLAPPWEGRKNPSRTNGSSGVDNLGYGGF